MYINIKWNRINFDNVTNYYWKDTLEIKEYIAIEFYKEEDSYRILFDNAEDRDNAIKRIDMALRIGLDIT